MDFTAVLGAGESGGGEKQIGVGGQDGGDRKLILQEGRMAHGDGIQVIRQGSQGDP